MHSKKCGVALFPVNKENECIDSNPRSLKIDHFAFNVNRANFEIAKKKYAELKLEHNIQDHYYFDSIYTKNPDGYTVELTTIKVDEIEFYK